MGVSEISMGDNTDDRQLLPGISITASGQATVDPSLTDVLFDLARRTGRKRRWHNGRPVMTVLKFCTSIIDGQFARMAHCNWQFLQTQMVVSGGLLPIMGVF